MTTRIDCDTCLVRGLACHDCVVTVLLGPPPELTIEDEERRALDVLAGGGLVPPLRMVEATGAVPVCDDHPGSATDSPDSTIGPATDSGHGDGLAFG
ncbi:hypothetical protein FB381_3181 [Nocardioides albertanoniae]|uniref:Uncharacterized protein n=1 Tax=Nocardioides albertanoniae TaxID=1175486 RepID=A0A543A9Z4_9ACTN|nr:hypothetical protein [Nocardioides albertanoniae]TQL69276.1 hypothetical protein FB381_3181 [Nocardioides albertanoniae]